MDKKQILKEYVMYLNFESKSQNTIKMYIYNIEEFLKWLYEINPAGSPVDLIELDLKKYQQFLKVKGLSVASIKQKMTSLISYSKFLKEKKYIKSDITSNLKLIKVQSSKLSPKVPSKSSVYAFKREVYKKGNIRDIAIVEVFLNTGLRVSELLNLKLENIEIGERKGSIIVEGKGFKSRILPLNNVARSALVEYIDYAKEKYDIKKEDTIWVGQRGSLKRTAALNKIIKKYAKKVGLEEEIYPHAFRHYFAHKLIVVNNVDIVRVATLLGHNDINTTRIYSLPSLKELTETLDNLKDD